jgi:putative transposase
MLPLRYARWDLTHVDLVDPRTGALLCPIKALDKSANARRAASALRAGHDRGAGAPSTGIAPLLRQLLADYAATGLPPAYLPSDDQEPA